MNYKGKNGQNKQHPKQLETTLMGKIQLIKSLAASKATYILAPLATNHKIIKEINDIFYSFLWNNKGDKIKRCHDK